MVAGAGVRGKGELVLTRIWFGMMKTLGGWAATGLNVTELYT